MPLWGQAGKVGGRDCGRHGRRADHLHHCGLYWPRITLKLMAKTRFGSRQAVGTRGHLPEGLPKLSVLRRPVPVRESGERVGAGHGQLRGDESAGPGERLCDGTGELICVYLCEQCGLADDGVLWQPAGVARPRTFEGRGTLLSVWADDGRDQQRGIAVRAIQLE